MLSRREALGSGQIVLRAPAAHEVFEIVVAVLCHNGALLLSHAMCGINNGAGE